MNNSQWAVILVIFLVAAIYVSIRNKKEYERKLELKLKKEWGKKREKKLSQEELETVSHFFRNTIKPNQYVVDDITWNDLSMDDIFHLINNTNSSIGREYLYRLLRIPQVESMDFDDMERLVFLFSQNKALRKKIQKEFYKLGYSKKAAVSDYIELITELKCDKVVKHYLCWLLIGASILVSCFLNATLGIVLTIAAICYSVVTYYRWKAQVEPFFICVGYVVKISTCAENVSRLAKDQMQDVCGKLHSLASNFKNVVNGAWLLGATGGMSGSLAEIVMDYIRILTHLDLIKFNSMVKSLNKDKDTIWELYNLLGLMESCIAIASFREYLNEGGYCIPQLSEGNKASIIMEDGYHPMISNPVKNSLNEDKSILITGSNASGKSTFLKMLAINQILAQTIHTCAASKYEASVFRVYSSMALRDSIVQKDSYYMVEIKSIKRIMEEAKRKDLPPVLCFVDEVLRGTNTIERIAASCQILKKLNEENALCVAATHDIELTTMLENDYNNYHFQEQVLDDDVKFDYIFQSGKATSRNAIRLLKMIGFDDSIVENAEKMAQEIERQKG